MKWKLYLPSNCRTIPMFAGMAGIYIHIPFCRKACHYCNFHFSVSFEVKAEMVRAMVVEIALQKDYLAGQEINTIYFGGGTPSALPIEDIDLILRTIREYHVLSEDVEVTLEANPDDINYRNIARWKDAGVNRLSIGIQAFQDELLTAWNRTHDASQAGGAISLVHQGGISNITADLIYGGAGLSDQAWTSNIHRLIDAGIPHISSYALTVETGTALFHQIAKGKALPPDDEQANRQYRLLQETMHANGYRQYEVSNFAKEGFESKHNRSYWSGAHYLGIGPSGHSYNGNSRQWNVAHNIKYIQTINEGIIPFEKEDLTDEQHYNELVMTGLRTSRGIEAQRLEALGEKYVAYFKTHVQPYVEKGQVMQNDAGNWQLQPSYFFFADGIASELFYME